MKQTLKIKNLKIRNKFNSLKQYMPIRFLINQRSFSETGEDIIAEQLLPEKTGKYLDVGCSHPIIYSNSYKFYKKGWSGKGVDANPNFEKIWKKLRPRDQFMTNLISIEKGKKEFYITKNSLTSSGNKKLSGLYKRQGKIEKIIWSPTITIGQLLPLKLTPSEPFLLTIDIEGDDLESLKGIDFKNQKPRVIIIENLESRKTKKFELEFKKFNYELFAFTGLSEIYVHKSYTNKRLKNRKDLSKILNDKKPQPNK